MARQGIKGNVKVEKVKAEARRNSPYKRGANRERQFAVVLEGEGWSVTRSAGSRSPHDLVACTKYLAWDAGGAEIILSEVLYVQVKTDRRSPWGHFGPAERELLLAAAGKAGATPVLVWWPPNSKPKWYFSHEWPTNTPTKSSGTQ